MLLAVTLLAALFAQPPETAPPDPTEAARLEEEERQAELRAVEAAEEAEQIAGEIALLQRQLIDLGRRVSDSEEAALGAEQAITRLSAEEAEILARLGEDREALIDVLAAIQRIETQAPPAVLAAPDDAADAARAAALMAEVAPALRRRAEALMLELDALRAVRDETLTQRETLSSAETVLARQRLEIEVLIAERRSLESRRRNEAAEFADLASTAGEQARSLRSLLGELQRMAEVSPNISPRRVLSTDSIPSPRVRPSRELVAARPLSSPLQTLRFADARGRLRQPAAGEIVRSFGEDDSDGNTSEGIFIRTRARAQVISPFDARIEYAGPFNTYGGLLILNVGDDYYVVLAGMAATYASAGQSVLAGEPVGAMADQSEPAPELYLELRRGSSAVNPGPWLSTD
jgi:septal ring factor EnvC (AmiA/AmiB activator)